MTTNNAAVKTFKELEKLNIKTTKDYFGKFCEVLSQTVVTAAYPSRIIPVDHAIGNIVDRLETNIRMGKKIMAIGNGGSAAIAIHTLTDCANAGGLRTSDFMSPALLTCMSNDYGYENVFAKPIEIFADEGDILFAISSSGKSPNILKACEAAVNRGCKIVTFSGFSPDNPLRKAGYLNFYVPSTHYGFVEIAHQALIHCILDFFLSIKKSE
ncbi:MAG: SIS domain-containing protein [bacterium]|nr:SIS domain-containing protein [bacterium]